MSGCDAGFFEWLLGLRCEGLTVQAVQEGTVRPAHTHHIHTDTDTDTHMSVLYRMSA